jgi:hypothetical protein
MAPAWRPRTIPSARGHGDAATEPRVVVAPDASQNDAAPAIAAPFVAMAETVFTFSCPCCQKRIEVDTRSGRARAVRAEEAKGGQSLDDLLRAQKSEQQRLGDLFSHAKETEAQRSERLARELERAKQAARLDPKEKPRNPFDLE